MSSAFLADALNSIAVLLGILVASVGFLVKISIDYLEARKARERLIAAEKQAFQVTKDADFSDLEAELTPPERFARERVKQAHAESVSAAKLSDLYAKQIEKYQTDTQARASWSFFFAVFSMLGGLGFVVWGGTHLLTSPGWEHVAGATAIAGIGGSIGAFIAKTFLDVHRLSLSQLNHYFRQPVVNAHVLTGQRLADQLVEPDARQKGYELLLQRVAELIREDMAPRGVWSELQSNQGRPAASASIPKPKSPSQ